MHYPQRGRKSENGKKSRIRLLIIDDEPSLCLTLTRALGDDYETICENSISNAIQRLANNEEFDAILCDLNMPEGSGISLYRSVEKKWPGRESRILFITGGANDIQTSRFLKNVPNLCLEKPFDLATLEKSLRISLNAQS